MKIIDWVRNYCSTKKKYWAKNYPVPKYFESNEFKKKGENAN
jgi:hypothetical protein